MATFTFSIATDDGTTINVTHTATTTDQALTDLLDALHAQNPGATNMQLFTGWVHYNMKQLIGIVQSYKQSLVVQPNTVTYSITS